MINLASLRVMSYIRLNLRGALVLEKSKEKGKDQQLIASQRRDQCGASS